ncbi:hypothetical protein Scep_015105 [Stephania cephalantha]|uniref:Uncharacterized protein n=1 Tax=Stephania cephalantha TaxID=152367 RepID=A0AAP0J2K7_9MAGN
MAGGDTPAISTSTGSASMAEPLHGHHGRHFDHPTINNVNGLPPPQFSRAPALFFFFLLSSSSSVSPPPGLMSVRCEKERCGRVYVREKVR